MDMDKSEIDGLGGVDLARLYASKGIRVLPVAPAPAKRPLIGAWQDKATDDRQTIEAWWRRHPEARVGMATGEPGFDALDFDVSDGKPGLAQMEKLIDLGVIQPGTFYYVGTPSGGRHMLFKGSQQRNKQNEKTIPGVDFRGRGGMVLAAGNEGYELIARPHAGLGTVDWEAIRAALAPPETEQTTTLVGPPANRPGPAGMTASPLPPVPTGAVSGRKPTRLVAPHRGGQYDDPIGEESPLDWYTRNYDIEQLLESGGWTFAYEAEGKRHYVRPGKKRSEGSSGNVATMGDGRRVFYNFSSTTNIPTDTALSTAMLFAWMYHGGDQRAAASDIRRTMMPQRIITQTMALVGPPVSLVSDTPTAIPPGRSDTGGGDLVPAKDAGTPKAIRDFWLERPELRNIRWLARQRRVSPWATLGAVLALVSCRVGPHVVLPPIVGGVASLNLLVGLVGASGKGKGAAWAVAEEYLGVRGLFMTEEVGTAQGIDASFTEPTQKAGPVQFNDVAFFYVPEIDTIAAHAAMAGSPLLPTLRKVWSGEALGAKYATKDKRRPVRAHSYRASVVAGIQPARSGVLLDDVDGGTPQRWIWLPVHDPDALRRTDKLKPPLYSGSQPQIDFDVWVPFGEQRGEKDEPLPVDAKSRWEIPVCQSATNEIIDAREANLVSESSSLDSHSLLTRLKVAALLAFLDRRAEVSEDDWRISKAIMWISNKSRTECQKARDDAEEHESRKRGRSRAVAAVEEDVQRVAIKDKRADRIHELGLKTLARLQAHPGREFSPRELMKANMDASAITQFGADILVALLAVPGVVQGPEITSGGRKIRKIAWSPSNSLLGRASGEHG